MKNQSITLIGTPKTIFSNTILDAIKQNAKDAESITMVTGYLTTAGWKLIKKEIEHAIKRKCLVRLFSDSSFLNTDYSLIYNLNKKLNIRYKNFYGMVFNANNIPMLHAKMLIFDKINKKSVVIIGSSNITNPALFSNLEAGITFDIKNTTPFYRNISAIVEALEENSHEPSKDELANYIKNKKIIEMKRKVEQNRIIVRNKYKIPNTLFSIKKFRSQIKQEFNDKNLLNNVQMALRPKDTSDYNDTNKAVQKFTEIVLKNRIKFSEPHLFKSMLRIYANILDHRSRKHVLEELLKDLRSSMNIRNETIRQIMIYSVPGLYRTITRGLGSKFRITQSHILETLNLIQNFYTNKNYEALLVTFLNFDKKTKNMKPRGIGLITGILSSLRPSDFIVWNRRTRSLRKISKQEKYKKILSSKSFNNYPFFNEIFRYISQRLGINDLRKLDAMSSEIYVQLRK